MWLPIPVAKPARFHSSTSSLKLVTKWVAKSSKKMLTYAVTSCRSYWYTPGPYKVLQLSASPDDLCKFHYYSAVHRYFSAPCTPYLLTAWCTTTLQRTELQTIRAQLGACHNSLQLSALMILCSASRHPSSVHYFFSVRWAPINLASLSIVQTVDISQKIWVL